MTFFQVTNKCNLEINQQANGLHFFHIKNFSCCRLTDVHKSGKHSNIFVTGELCNNCTCSKNIIKLIITTQNVILKLFIIIAAFTYQTSWHLPLGKTNTFHQLMVFRSCPPVEVKLSIIIRQPLIRFVRPALTVTFLLA